MIQGIPRQAPGAGRPPVPHPAARIARAFALALLALALTGGAARAAERPPEEEGLRARLLEIVREECDKAFARRGEGVLEPAQLSAVIVPMIADEVTRRAIPLILATKHEEEGPDNLPVATVNGAPVKLSELRIELAKMAPAMRKQMLTAEKIAGYLDEILLPKRMLLDRVAALGLAKNRDVKRQLSVAFENLLVETYLKRKSDDLRGSLATRFTDAQTRDYYRDNLERLYQVPPRVTLAHIVKRFPAGNEAARQSALETMKRAVKDLEDGVTFETVARKYSDDTKATLGRFRKDEPARDPVVRHGLSLMLGRPSEIVEGADGWYVVMVREMEEARTIPFEEVRKNIVVSLANERLAGELEVWIRDLRRSHEIEIFAGAVTAEVGVLPADVIDAPAAKRPDAKKPDAEEKAGRKTEKKETAKERRARQERERKEKAAAKKAAAKKAPEKPRDPNDDVLGTVDGQPILRRDFHEYLEQVPGRYAEMMTSPEGRLSIMERLVNKRVILYQARAEGFENDPEFRDAFADLEAKILTKNLILEEVASKIKITDKEIDDYFARHPDEVKARHILISVPEGAPQPVEEEARARATTALERARAGEDFAALARECSDDPSRIDGGYLGYFGDDAMVEPFSRQAFAMGTNEISPLVRTPYGFHIIKVEDRRMRPRTEEARRHARDRVLAPARQNESFRAYVSELRRKAAVQVDRAAIERALKEGLLEK